MIRKETDTHEAIRAIEAVITEYRQKLRQPIWEDIAEKVIQKLAAITSGEPGEQRPVDIRYILHYVPHNAIIDPNADYIPHMLTQLKNVRDLYTMSADPVAESTAAAFDEIITAISNGSGRIPAYAIIFF